METITLTYDPTSIKAIELLKEILSSGVFKEQKKVNKKSQETEAFIVTSRRNASLIFGNKI